MEQGTFNDVIHTEAYRQLEYSAEKRKTDYACSIGVERKALSPLSKFINEDVFNQIQVIAVI